MKTAQRCVFFLALSILATATVRADDSAYKVATGPLPVNSAEAVTLTDAKRKREIVVRVNYPDGKGPFPVIVFSHGFGASKDAFGPISQHWASHGYVCVHPQHADARTGGKADEAGSTQSDKKTLRDRLGQGGLGGLNSPGKLSDRVADVTAVLDALDQIETAIPALKGQLDRKRIGVGGHSYGACVSMLVGGATVEVGGMAKSFADPRVKCVLPISAAGAGEYGLSKDSWNRFAVPALYVTGTKDIRPGHDPGWRKEPFDGSPAGDKFFLNIEGANHFSFGGGPSGGRLAALGGRMESFTPLVKTATVAFWDAYLKDDDKAKEYLKRDSGFNAYAGTKAKLSAK